MSTAPGLRRPAPLPARLIRAGDLILTDPVQGQPQRLLGRVEDATDERGTRNIRVITSPSSAYTISTRDYERPVWVNVPLAAGTVMSEPLAPRPPLGEVREGTEVLVIQPWGRAVTTTIPARITKAARVWLDLEEVEPRMNGLHGRTWRMRRDTQDEGNRQYSHNSDRFVTPEQHAYDVRVQAARALLAKQGLHVEMTSQWGDEAGTVRLADLLAGETP